MKELGCEKKEHKYYCEPCHYNTSRKSSYDKHILTDKHFDRTNLNTLEQKNCEKNYTCNICNKVYKARNSLWYHEKKCNNNEPNINDKVIDKEYEKVDNNLINIILKENTDFKNLVLQVVKNNSELLQQNQEYQKQNQEYQKQNQDLQKQVLEVCQKIQPSNTTNHINSHNKTFNLQLFLNEQCKDAMNIMDFVNTFQLDFSDFERIGEVGYIEGISNIVINKLNEMDVHKRPIHCSDAKREIMYVKDKDVWEKENANNDKIRLALKHITKKNSDLIRPWANAHPGVLDSDHRLSDKYQEMIIEAMGGNSGTIKECETKIIKKISKMVLIDKCQ